MSVRLVFTIGWIALICLSCAPCVAFSVATAGSGEWVLGLSLLAVNLIIGLGAIGMGIEKLMGDKRDD